ncbi:hypothetical protein TWF696_001712 [Orbilia brochopaga]|uniref:Uncharacterized protein n=1 Tax=Orbilia brochopaga TaxID=3140254 RepID=A0AAV9U7Y4_9PEZI
MKENTNELAKRFDDCLQFRLTDATSVMHTHRPNSPALHCRIGNAVPRNLSSRAEIASRRRLASGARAIIQETSQRYVWKFCGLSITCSLITKSIAAAAIARQLEGVSASATSSQMTIPHSVSLGIPVDPIDRSTSTQTG